MTRREMMMRAGLLSVAPLLPGRGQHAEAAESGGPEVLAEFPIKNSFKLITVPVTYRGKTYRFGLDTGATFIIYDRSFEPDLGTPRRSVRIITASGSVPAQTYDAPDAMLGPLDLRTVEPVTCADLSLTGHQGERVHGIIGMSFLGQYALTLDFTHGRVQFRREAALDEAHALPIRYDRRKSPLVDLVLPGEEPRPYTLDTGCLGAAASVERATFDRLLERRDLRFMYEQRMSDLAAQEGTVRRVGSLRRADVAGVRLSGLDLWETPSDRIALGMAAIRRLNWVLDFPAGRMNVTWAAPWSW